MIQLVIKKIKLSLRIYKLVIVGILKMITRKYDFNTFLKTLEMNKVETRLDFWKTIYFNFRTMPAKYAWKTPVWVYGKIEFYSLTGKCLPLKSTVVKPGTFVLGHMDQVRSNDTISSITMSGTIYYGNNVVLRQGAKLRLGGNLILEDNVYIGDNNTFIITKECRIKEMTRVANNVTFMDTDIHYMIDIVSKRVAPNARPIEIGKGNWIGSNSMIKKGVKTPNFMILVGPYSCLTKDYTKSINEYACLAGSPAKLIKEGLRRINNTQSEQRISEYYAENDAVFELDGDIETFCSPC